MQFWYSRSLISWFLLPFSALFWLIASVRRGLFRLGILKSYKANIPVIIVGNISVGGNGKTPVVIWLAKQLTQRGIKVGIISRGYGSEAKAYPMLVSPTSNVIESGDEPLLIAQATNVPVCISPNRQQSIELLQQHYPIEVIISDDGLQHYQLQRDIEIVVMDSERGLGNGLVLPAGPLREFAVRLQEVDLVIANGKANQYSHAVMELVPHYAINLVTGEKCLLTDFNQITAIAGIGNPQRFFTMLSDLGLQLVEQQAFPDHKAFDEHSLYSIKHRELPLLMTEKDAVKCKNFAHNNWWYVPVEAVITGQKLEKLLTNLVTEVKGES